MQLTTRTFPSEWGRTRCAAISRPEDTEAAMWEMPDWSELTLPGSDGDYHHGSDGAVAPDTAALSLDGVIVALCDCGNLGLENLYVYDSEYYQYLRLREVLDPALFGQTPWGGFAPGQIIFAWDKFTGIEYTRSFDVDPEFSYGGDWDDLEAHAFKKAPHTLATPPTDDRAPPSIHLLCSLIRAKNIDRLRTLLQVGADPSLPTDPPPFPGVSLPYSVSRRDSPLWVSVQEGTPEITALLLKAGAPVDQHPPDGMTALCGAILCDKLDQIPVLLAHGASLQATWQGKTLQELAAARCPELISQCERQE